MRKLIVYFTLLTLLLSGCSTGTQIEELAITLSTGIDEGTNGVTITSEILNSESKGGEEKGGKSAMSYYIESVSGENANDAFSKQKFLHPKEITALHNKVLVFGEKTLQNGITEIVSGFPRTDYLRGSNYIVAARGEARDIINSSSIENQSISESIVQLINRQGIKTKAVEFFKKSSSRNKRGAILPLLDNVETDGKKRLIISGVALLNNGKLTGYLNEKEMSLVAVLLNQGKNLRVKVKYKNKPVEVILSSGNIKRDCIFSYSKPKFIFKGDLFFKVDIASFGEVTKTKDISNLELLVRKELKKRYTLLMKKILVDYQCDALGFDDYLYRYRPSYWKVNQYKWNSILPEVETDFKMNVTIKNVGIHS